ncbi:hypothetical protein VB735_12680 [Halotia wernerae UHCC 0503]|nr:hypothetical protein [Halotia wernerae UHCC 0503]
MISICIATDPKLRQGDSGATVTELQQLLNAAKLFAKVDRAISYPKLTLDRL